jgi:hypothetical protein
MADSLDKAEKDVGFKTTLRQKEVMIDDKPYIIRELDGVDLGKTRGDMGDSVTVSSDGNASFSGINLQDPELKLLSLCLYDAEGGLVPRQVMEKWPATVLSGLYNIAQELSGLDKESRKKMEANAKNS